MESILTSIKKMLGIEAIEEHFDPEIIVYINSVFMTLHQIGVGPETGFSIVDNVKTWTEYLGESANLEAVKSYMYLKVRLIFDPPSSAFVLDAMERQASEIEWRLNVQMELLATQAVALATVLAAELAAALEVATVEATIKTAALLKDAEVLVEGGCING